MKYRKVPVEIEAFRLGYEDMPKWFLESDSGYSLTIERRIGGNIICDIKTLEGTMRANSGDYIIQGVKGELYPCRADIFEMTYEKVSG